MRLFASPLLMLLALGLSACAAGREPAAGGAGGSLSAGPVTLPAPGRLHHPSYLGSSVVQSGYEYAAELPHARVAGYVELYLDFAPDWDPAAVPPRQDPAFALYALATEGYSGLDQLRLRFGEPPPDGSCFIGLANFSAGRWDWHSLPATGELQLPSLAGLLSSQQVLYAAVVLLAPARLDYIGMAFDPPQAALSAPLSEGYCPFQTSFDASASLQPNGDQLRFSWDFEGSGDFTSPSFSAAHGFHTYEANGHYNARVRVTDAWGNTDEALVEIQVGPPPPAWHSVIAYDNPDGVVSQIALAEVAGRPALAAERYTDTTLLVYLRANDVGGDSWPAPIEVDEVHIYPWALTLLVSGAKPGLFYSDQQETIFWCSALDAVGGSWDSPRFVKGKGFSVTRGEMFDGLPAVCYFDDLEAQRGSWFRQAMTAEGIGWKPAQLAVAKAQLESGLGSIGGAPAIVVDKGLDAREAYYYVSALDSSGEDWRPPVEVLEAPAGYGARPMPAPLEVDGRPALFLRAESDDMNSAIVYYIRANDAQGFSWPAGQPLCTTNGVMCAAALLDGLPALLFVDDSGVFCKLVLWRADDAAGQSWTKETIASRDKGFVTGYKHLDLAEVNGGPAAAAVYNYWKNDEQVGFVEYFVKQ